MRTEASIYGLIAEGDTMFRYIGVTSRRLRYRLREHFREVEQGVDTHKCRWLRKCLREGRVVCIVHIVRVSISAWPEWERALIAKIPNLTNSQAGGIGSLGLSDEARAKISVKVRGRKFSYEHRLKLAKISRTRIRTPEEREKIAASQRGRHPTPETVAKLIASHVGKPMLPQTRAALLAANLGRKRRPETNEKIVAALRGKKFSPQHVQSLHNAWKLRKLRPQLEREAQFDIYELLGVDA